MAIRKIEKRTLPSGLVVYRAPYIDGTGKRRSKNFQTVKKAKQFLRATSSELVQGIHTPASTSPTVSEAAKFWIARCERRGLETTTLKQYNEHCDLHINPFIGGLKLSQLSPPRQRSTASLTGSTKRTARRK